MRTQYHYEMTRYVHQAINIRHDQFNARRNAIRVARTNLSAAFKAMYSTVLLYSPRGETNPGYFGTAEVVGVHPDLEFSGSFWLQLAGQRLFAKRITLEDLYDSGAINDTPFHTYSRTIRVVSKHELERLVAMSEVGEEPQRQFAESALELEPHSVLLPSRKRQAFKLIRRSIVRFQMLESYGPRCAFTDAYHPSLDGLRFAVQVGHLLPLRYGGPDILQNVVQMDGRVNWQWDEGIFTMRPDRTPIVSSKASSETRAELERFGRIHFPEDPRHWPKAEYLEAHRDLVFEKTDR